MLKKMSPNVELNALSSEYIDPKMAPLFTEKTSDTFNDGMTMPAVAKTAKP